MEWQFKEGRVHMYVTLSGKSSLILGDNKDVSLMSRVCKR